MTGNDKHDDDDRHHHGGQDDAGHHGSYGDAHCENDHIIKSTVEQRSSAEAFSNDFAQD